MLPDDHYPLNASSICSELSFHHHPAGREAAEQQQQRWASYQSAMDYFNLSSNLMTPCSIFQVLSIATLSFFSSYYTGWAEKTSRTCDKCCGRLTLAGPGVG